MSESELAAWLALSFTPKVGSKTLARLTAVDAPHKLIERDVTSLLSLGLSDTQIRYFKQGSRRDVDTCLEWMQTDHHHILTPLKCEYPPLLNEISFPPSVLFVKGRLNCLSQPQISMVGSRNASVEGLNTARLYATRFVEHGLVVTSGLALGIDGYAHDGALNGGGETIAVLGSGLDQVYPSRHKNLAQRVVESGALVSEFAPHIQPRPAHFPRRNRIISGLSVGVLVVEAAEKSGSLITARYAAEQGRDVFAIPGSIYNGVSHGGNSLIKNGACLVQSEQDVLDEIDTLVNWSINQRANTQAELFDKIDDEEELPFPQLLANVGIEATPVDILAIRTNIPVHEVMMQLLELELSGHVVAVSGGYIRNGRG